MPAKNAQNNATLIYMIRLDSPPRIRRAFAEGASGNPEKLAILVTFTAPTGDAIGYRRTQRYEPLGSIMTVQIHHHDRPGPNMSGRRALSAGRGSRVKHD